MMQFQPLVCLFQAGKTMPVVPQLGGVEVREGIIGASYWVLLNLSALGQHYLEPYKPGVKGYH